MVGPWAVVHTTVRLETSQQVIHVRCLTGSGTRPEEARPSRPS
jgi:hypothetical protein